MIDEIDKQILNILQNDGRITNADLARQINMAPSAVLERMRRLESKKIIQKYSATIDSNKVGLNLTAFVMIKSNGPVVDTKTAKEIGKIPEVQEVHIVAGEDCFLVKVRVADTNSLNHLLRNKFGKIENIKSTSTTIVLETVKESTKLTI
ncbi:MAG: Lrp/AsnC family transcriptional regulator [Ignavibacteriaceae bacterium]|nr:Lrp/AsnC family transcriptional regulator [Ignavibacteriaceae bacterium]HRI46331.1 Lrp/AsnC family transcriptional regulator [Ignavibacteriaceae bacterium]